MKKIIYCLPLLILLQKANAQHNEWRTGIRDTSFSVEKDYLQNLKYHPLIKIVRDQPSDSVTEARGLVYATPNGTPLHIDAFTPTTVSKASPSIIIIHGGGWRSGNRSQHIPLAQHLAAKGIACFTVEYRLSTDTFYPGAIHDLKAAVRWVRSNAARFKIDPNKINVLGFSAGGELAAFIGVTNGLEKFEGNEGNPSISSKVNSVIDMDGTLSFVHPDSWEAQNPTTVGPSAWWIGYPFTEHQDIWKEASPFTYTSQNKTPFLFLNSSVERMHAGRDDFKKAMDEKQVFVQIKEYPNTPHTFCLYQPWFDEVVKDIASFIYR